MQERSSLRAKLLLSLCGILMVTLFLPSWHYYRKLSGGMVEEYRNRAIQQLNMVQWVISQNASKLKEAGQLQEFVTEFGKVLGARITYMDTTGRILADSHVPASDISSLESFSSRPEVLQSRNQEVGLVIRLGKVTTGEYVYAARKAPELGPALPEGNLRLALSTDPLTEALAQLRKSYITVFIMILAAISFLAAVLLQQLKSPIRELIKATEDIGAGNYKRRIRFDPNQEFYPLAQSINRMVQAIDNRFRATSEQKQQLQAVFNGMQEGVMVLDKGGRIKSINWALARLIPNASQCIGRRPLEVFINLELQEACNRFLEAEDETPSSHLQVILAHERMYDVTIVRLREERRESGAIVVFHEITELKRLEKVRQDFVANVSHELRTPLTSIKGYTETILSENRPDSETFMSFLQIILKNTNHMVKMVDDLLQLSRLESHESPPRSAMVNVSDALMAAWKECAPLADSKHVRLDNLLPEHGLELNADYGQLVQVFRNLMENGIKYSPEGEALTVGYQTHKDKWTFAVQDRGPGIPKQYQQRIFERFYRVEKHRGTASGSTGLGLAICRHIIQNLGGRIWVESPTAGDSHGTTFFFSLPLEPQEVVASNEES